MALAKGSFFAGEGKKTGMIYIFGPYAKFGKREYVRETLRLYRKQIFRQKQRITPAGVLYDAQQTLASKVGNRPEELEKAGGTALQKKKSSSAMENRVWCRADRCLRAEVREADRRLSILLVKRAQKVIRV